MADDKSKTPRLEDPGVTDEDKYDQSRRAEAVLDYILHGENAEGQVAEEGVAVSEALKARPVIDIDTGRTSSRVLFVTTNEAVLESNSLDCGYYLNLSGVFDEVHVLVLVPRRGNDAFERVESNVWVYKVHSKHWWSLPWKAKGAAERALTFNGNIRPDIIIGVDPFEAGLGAYFIAKRFARPFQLHLKTNPFAPDFIERREDNNWRLRIAKYLLKRTQSIRTESEKLKKVIKSKYKKIKEIYTLPHFYNFSGLLSAEPSMSLKEKYPQYAFVMLSFGPLTADSHLHDLFTALRPVLLNKRIGLVVIGDGPAKALFVEKVSLLGIAESVIFQKEAEDLPSYLKTADALVEVSTSQDSEINILRATAAGLPIIAMDTDLRSDLFDGIQAAYLCDAKDLQCLSQKVSHFINQASLRVQFKNQLQTIATERLQEDPDAYYLAIRDTIESILVPVEESKDKVETNNENQQKAANSDASSG